MEYEPWSALIPLPRSYQAIYTLAALQSCFEILATLLFLILETNVDFLRSLKMGFVVRSPPSYYSVPIV